MSETSITHTGTAISRTPSILLSPSKRRRLDNDQPSGAARDAAGTRPDEAHEGRPQPTPADILRWTFTRAAIASCFVRDVFEMKECGTKDMEYFWLGRIPCRTVRLVGLVVGVQVWEKRTVYTIDDGTAVVDCALAHAQATPPSPAKPKPKPVTSTKEATKSTGPSFADYLLSARKVPAPTAAAPTRKIIEPPPPPNPVVRVGQSARVVGRVVPRFDERLILVDEISRCASYNDESKHCIDVSELHRTTYYPSEPMPPFVPPPPPTSSSRASQHLSSTRRSSPTKRVVVQEPATPASARSNASSTTTSPSTSVAASSPASNSAETQVGSTHLINVQALIAVKVPRLRHPSRLHTRDLTANTFRIYVKHYMDNAPPPSRRPRRAVPRSESPSPTSRLSQARRPENLAKSRDRLIATGVDATPRPSRSLGAAMDRTPCARLASDTDSEDESDDDEFGSVDQMYGYTLSHLRRVPELALLARRVVKADAHRRAKEERKKAKSGGTQPNPKPASASSSRQPADALPGPAIKRLFKQTIRTLFSEGDIVLWNGPVRPIPEPVLDSVIPSSCPLWKANTSTSSTTSSMSSRSGVSYEDWDEEEALSDPTPGEEAYVPLTPAYFSRVLEGAIRAIMAEVAESAARSREATPKPKSKSSNRGTSLIDRLRAQEKENAGPPPGPTKEELLVWLRRSDERWERVGEWSVEEALQWGRKEGRLWCVGKGRWEVCG